MAAKHITPRDVVVALHKLNKMVGTYNDQHKNSQISWLQVKGKSPVDGDASCTMSILNVSEERVFPEVTGYDNKWQHFFGTLDDIDDVEIWEFF